MFVSPVLSHPGEPPALSSTSTRRRVSLLRAATLTHPFRESGWARKRFKFVIRAWAQRDRTHRWLSELTRPETAPLWLARPRISTKLQRPYVCCDWTVEQRLQALLSHYTLLPQLLRAEALDEIYRDKVEVAALTHPDGRGIAVRLFYRDNFEKEGDLTLSVDDVSTGLTLAGITFSLGEAGGTERRIVIGGLQASPGPQTRELINEVTKQLHGMRPKAFALWCVQQLAAVWSVSQLVAVSDAQHIYRHSHKRRDFSASYDEFWSESDGQREENGFWKLPLQLRHRHREELKPSRRKAHERRYAFLTAFQPILRDALLELRPISEHGAPLCAKTPVFSLAFDAAAASGKSVNLDSQDACVVAIPLQAIAPRRHANHSY